jgi:hypothetical protein
MRSCYCIVLTVFYKNSCSVQVQVGPKLEPNPLNLNLRSGPEFSEIPGPNHWFGSWFSKYSVRTRPNRTTASLGMPQCPSLMTSKRPVTQAMSNSGALLPIYCTILFISASRQVKNRRKVAMVTVIMVNCRNHLRGSKIEGKKRKKSTYSCNYHLVHPSSE